MSGNLVFYDLLHSHMLKMLPHHSITVSCYISERQQQEDERRSLTRRGRGRPRKRKLLATPSKLDSRPGK